MVYSHEDNSEYDPFKLFQATLQHFSSDPGVHRNDKHSPDPTKKPIIELC